MATYFYEGGKLADTCDECGFYWKAHPPSGECPGPRGPCARCVYPRSMHLSGQCPLNDPAMALAADPPYVPPPNLFDFLRKDDD